MIHSIIMAGGFGTRFWPASRRKRPKQFLTISGDQSMLEQTAERLLPLCGWERTAVVATPELSRPIRKLLPQLPKENLIVEPRPRNTAPAIGLAAIEILRRDPDGIMVVLPADHMIRPPGKFRKLIRAACTVARSGALVTLGVSPTKPETGYGYIEAGRRVGSAGGSDVFEVKGFEEKPDFPTAVKYLKAGDFYWNSGMFVFSAEAILQAMERHMPVLHSGLMDVLQAGPRRSRVLLRNLFEEIDGMSIDYGVMEKAANMQMLPCDLFWSDVGSWAALPEVQKHDDSGNVCSGDVLAIDSQGCIIQSKERLVACVGLRDVIVVETADAVLVCPRDQAQSVRQIVEQLRLNEREDML